MKTRALAVLALLAATACAHGPVPMGSDVFPADARLFIADNQRPSSQIVVMDLPSAKVTHRVSRVLRYNELRPLHRTMPSPRVETWGSTSTVSSNNQRDA
jgi:hypothetical protein